MSPRPCPTAEVLAAYSRGALPVHAIDEVADHLEACPACDTAVATLDRATDDLIGSLRQIAPPASDAPHRVGDYDIVATLGQGGMGVVYKAVHRSLGRVVGLKMMASSGPATPAVRDRFRAEILAIARLQHSNIVQLYEVGEHHGRPYFTMEFVDGQNLSERLAAKPQPPAVAAGWAATLAQAIAYAHGQGIVHRDLKPSNVLIATDGTLKLCDFGVAKLTEGSAALTSTGLLVGTPEYMAPEQASGRPEAVGPAVDIHALGAVLYATLVGRPPFQSAQVLDTLEQVRVREPVPPRRLEPHIPRDLETICLRCLEKDPARRYPTAASLAEDLNRFLSGQTILARPAGPAERFWKWARQRPAVAALVAMVAMLVSVGLPLTTVLWLRADRARMDEAEARREAVAQGRATERAYYFSKIALAKQALQNDSVTVAREQLAACPKWLHDWEWDYLTRLCHTEFLRVDADQPQAWVHDVAIHPDGNRFVAAIGIPPGLTGQPAAAQRDTPGRIAVFDSSGRPLESFPTSGTAFSVCYHPDGRSVAWAAGDGSVWIDEAGRGQRRLQEAEPCGTHMSIRYSPDGRWLAADTGHVIRVWEAGTGKLRLRKDKDYRRFTFADDGRLLVFDPGLKSRPVLIWNPTTNQETSTTIPADSVDSIACGRENLVALSRRGEGVIEVWDLREGRLLRELAGHDGRVHALRFAPDGRLASAGDDGAVRTWNPGTHDIPITFRGHTSGVLGLAFDGYGKRLVTAGKDGTARLWDATRDPAAVAFLALDGLPGERFGQMAFSDAGQQLRVLTKNAGDSAVLTWDAATGRQADRQATPGAAGMWSPHRDLALTASGTAAFPHPSDLTIARVVNGPSGKAIDLRHIGQVRAIAMSADGSRVACGTGNVADPGQVKGLAEVAVWEVATGREVARFPNVPTFVSVVALSPDGKRLAFAARDTRPTEGRLAATSPISLEVHDLESGQRMFRFESTLQSIAGLAFDPIGEALATAEYTGRTVRVWDLRTGRERFRREFPSLVTSVAFHPSGRRLATAWWDGVVRILDAETGDEAISLPLLGGRGTGHYNFTPRVAFSPDGRRLAANNWRGHVTVWEAGGRNESAPGGR